MKLVGKAWVLVLLFLGSCATAPVVDVRNEGLERWVGHPLSDLVATWGAPATEAHEEGNHVFFWPATRYGQRTLPANLAPGNTDTVFGTLEDYRCRAAVVVDAEETIVAATWRGEECFNNR